jgi:hypothetical protein
MWSENGFEIKIFNIIFACYVSSLDWIEASGIEDVQFRICCRIDWSLIKMDEGLVQLIASAGHGTCSDAAVSHLEEVAFSVCMREVDRDCRHPPSGRTERYLHPGSVLTVYPEGVSSETKLNAVLSAIIYDGSKRKFGLTVGHVFSTVGDVCFTTNHEDFGFCDSLLGSCVLLEREVVLFNGKTITADIALIELSPDIPPVHNVIRLPSYFVANGSSVTAAASAERTFERFQVKSPSSGAKVLVHTAHHGWVPGTVNRSSWTVKFSNSTLHNVILIALDDGESLSCGQTRVESGDSGGLVIGLPADDQSVLEVYGLLIGRVALPGGRGKSFAVATRLYDVLVAITHDSKYAEVFNGFRWSRSALCDHSLELGQSKGVSANEEQSQPCGN